MTKVRYKNSSDDEWRGFTVTDGDPTGRIYSFWLPSDFPLEFAAIVKFLNSQITCICESPIDPVSLKFELLERPREDEPYYGYGNEDHWTAREITLEKSEL